MEDTEKSGLEWMLSQLAIVRQSFEDKNNRLRELERENRYLKDLVKELSVIPRLSPASVPSQPLPKKGAVPRRWHV